MTDHEEQKHDRNDRLKEFQGLYQEEFGESIGEDEAREITLRLVELYMMFAEPLPSERASSSTPSEALLPETGHPS